MRQEVGFFLNGLGSVCQTKTNTELESGLDKRNHLTRLAPNILFVAFNTFIIFFNYTGAGWVNAGQDEFGSKCINKQAGFGFFNIKPGPGWVG